jgi:hypothetical protein
MIRWGMAAGLVSLQLVMNAPVWALIERVNLTGSNSSYHRYQLVDQLIQRVVAHWSQVHE